MELIDIHYFTPREIAKSTGLTVRRIQQGVKRAREMQVDLATIWRIEWVANDGNSFNNACDIHGGPNQEFPRELPKGCQKCCKSGLDHLIHRPSEPPKDPEALGTKYSGPPLTREKGSKSRSGPTRSSGRQHGS